MALRHWIAVLICESSLSHLKRFCFAGDKQMFVKYYFIDRSVGMSSLVDVLSRCRLSIPRGHAGVDQAGEELRLGTPPLTSAFFFFIYYE